MIPETKSEAAVIFDHAARLSAPLFPGLEGYVGTPKLLVPAGYTVKDMEGWKPEIPNRVEARLTTHDLQSFVDYIDRFAIKGTCLFAKYATTEEFQLEAVIDYHGEPLHPKEGEVIGEVQIPDWCAHTIVYKPKFSREWLRWNSINGKPISQVAFAAFLEDNTQDVASPKGADLLGIVNTFKVDKQVTYSKDVTLQNGNVKFTFNSESKARGIGEMEVPERFRLQIPVFHRGVSFAFDVKFRYRVDEEGKLTLWVEIVNKDVIIQAAVDQALEHIRKVLAQPLFIADR